MRHAGLDNGEPSGFSDFMYVNRSQLFDVTDIERVRAPFLEPFSCVLRSWVLSNSNIEEEKQIIFVL